MTRDALRAGWPAELPFAPRALVIRTLPNEPGKRTRDYTDMTPPYLTREAAQCIVERGIEHLVVDLPSIDRTHDEGRLTAHRLFFGLPPGDSALDPREPAAMHSHRAGIRPGRGCRRSLLCCSCRCPRSPVMPYRAGRCSIGLPPEPASRCSMSHDTYEPTAEFARRLDEADPLRGFRERFALPRGAGGEPLVYLCGHSLGLMPLAARALRHRGAGRLGAARGPRPRAGAPALDSLSREPARRARGSHRRAPRRGRRDELADSQPAPDARGFYRPSGARQRILIEAGAFSSDRHAVASQIAWHGLDPQEALIELSPPRGRTRSRRKRSRRTSRSTAREIALVLWPGVQYRTGQAFDLGRIARAAHRAGCVAGFDLAHSIGNMPLALHDIDADFAVWCSYKYLNGGPGAIGGCFVHERARPSPPGRLVGARAGHPLSHGPEFDPAPGAAGWQISNPPILAAAPLIASLALFEEAGIAATAAKSVALTGYLEYLLDRLAPDVQLITPRAIRLARLPALRSHHGPPRARTARLRGSDRAQA